MLPIGFRVLVTRPLEQAGTLSKLITEAGGEAVLLPLIEIEKLGMEYPGPSKLKEVEGLDWLIFISKTAVDCAQALWGSGWIAPKSIKFAAIGKGTAARLADYGFTVHLQPQDQSNTEALLEHVQLASLSDQRIGIVRGVGGRELLGDVLRQRGALIEYFELYKRKPAVIDPDFLVSLWRKRGINAVVTTSGESLQRLVEVITPSGAEILQETPIVVIGNRLAVLARDKGCRHVVAAGASDDELFNAVLSVAESQTKTLQIRG